MSTRTDYRPDLVGDGWDDEPLLNARQVAERLGVSRRTAYDLPIPRVRVARNAIRWRPQDVREFVARRVEAA